MDFNEEASIELNIIHIDMDAFYASVEQRDNPRLKGKPVIIGGKSRRGVVSTASYEARKYGVHSAMSAIKAKKLCPKGIFLRPNHDKYKRVSKRIREIFYQYTDIVEPLSLDEAFLDVGNVELNSIRIAKEIVRKIKEQLNLVASVGISYNKYLAKLASDFNKPNGFKIISPFEARDTIYPLDISYLWGVGPKTAQELKELGYYKIKDIAQTDKNELIRKLGKRGYHLYKLAHGEDDRVVSPPSFPKSIGKECTFHQDTDDKEVLNNYLRDLSNQVAVRVIRNQLNGKTVVLKVKYEDFDTISRSRTVDKYIKEADEIYKIASSLLEEVDLKGKVRLIGVTLNNLVKKKIEQLFF